MVDAVIFFGNPDLPVPQAGSNHLPFVTVLRNPASKVAEKLIFSDQRSLPCQRTANISMGLPKQPNFIGQRRAN
jgi:hypothetical protein